MKVENKLHFLTLLMQVIHGNIRVLLFLATLMMQSTMIIQEEGNSHGTCLLVQTELVVRCKVHGKTMKLAMKQLVK